jgi:hypothetical protein
MKAMAADRTLEGSKLYEEETTRKGAINNTY